MKAIATIGAWISEYRQEEFAQALHSGDATTLVSSIALSNNNMTGFGWTRVGTAEVTLEVEGEDVIRQNMVSALRAQQKEVQAKAQAEVVNLEQRVQDLLAIEYEAQS